MDFIQALLSSLTLEHMLTLMGLIIPATSALASAVNHQIRERQGRSEPVSAWLLKGGAALNLLAVNLDKAAQLAKMAKPAVPPPAEPPPCVPVEDVVAQIEQAAAPEPTPEPAVAEQKPRNKPKKPKGKKPAGKKKKA